MMPLANTRLIWKNLAVGSVHVRKSIPPTKFGRFLGYGLNLASIAASYRGPSSLMYW